MINVELKKLIENAKKAIEKKKILIQIISREIDRIQLFWNSTASIYGWEEHDLSKDGSYTNLLNLKDLIEKFDESDVCTDFYRDLNDESFRSRYSRGLREKAIEDVNYMLFQSDNCRYKAVNIEQYCNDIQNAINVCEERVRTELQNETREYLDELIRLSQMYREISYMARNIAESHASCGSAVVSGTTQYRDDNQKDQKAQPNVSPKEDIRQHESAQLDDVQFSAIAPHKFVRGEYSLIEIIMYEEQYRDAVDEIIAKSEVAVKETKKSGIYSVEHGSTVRILLTSPDLVLEDNEEERQWSGKYVDFSFAINVPEDYSKKQILFNAIVYFGNVVATRLKFVAKCISEKEQKMDIIRKDIFSAFVSYANQDRSQVAMRIQGMKKIRPELDIFFDIDSLRSGEKWEKTIKGEIEKRDIFFLCWSHFARDSEWVEKEWRYALENKGIECIEPIPMELPICPPPVELNQMHFNDKLLYIINVEEQ